NRVLVTEPVSRVAPGVFGAGRQSVHLKPSAPAIDGLYVLPKIDLIFAYTYPLGVCGVAAETAGYAAVRVDCSRKEYDASGRLRRVGGKVGDHRASGRTVVIVSDSLCEGDAGNGNPHYSDAGEGNKTALHVLSPR